ncbi:M23 family metallopeptidase [Actinomyces sp. zg-332]|uniref:M23 family metallopeptidase n=1 Tax=Actinomyces sp. zg-332 TaxID=2708340 RepID=UPI00141E30EA|nr:M23 family metallopeptidase [Actinomyces sp. zg-332]QPK94404.1 M23 family metallopeptidase [Actinomyces sp. zg-332]
MSDSQNKKKLPSRRELIEAEKKRNASRDGVVSDTVFHSQTHTKFKIAKPFITLVQILAVIVIPVTGALNIPLSSLGATETYESMLTKLESEKIDSNSNFNKVVSPNSRYKVIAGSDVKCTPSNSANGDTLANKNFELQWPLREGTFTQTSPFGYRSDPLSGRNVLHSGADLAGPVNTPIMSIADGKVKTVDVYGGAGRVIIVHNIKGVEIHSWYLHMYPNGIYVKEGQEVKMGDIIAGIGSSGYSTGPHLHIEIHPNGDDDAVDPIRWLKENKAVLLSKDC